MKLAFAATALLAVVLDSAWAFGTPKPRMDSMVAHGRPTAVGPSFLASKHRRGLSPLSATTLSAVSAENLSLLSERGRQSIENLIKNDDGSQSHVYADWPEAGVQDEQKSLLADQVSCSEC